MRNMSKVGKQLCSLLLTLLLVMVISPVSLMAEEGNAQTKTQVSSETEAEMNAESKLESETSEQMETEPSESTETTETTQSVESESHVQSNTGSISGMLWYDENCDGIHDNGETGIMSYPVYLYKADDTDNTVQTLVTDENGEYAFTDIEAGIYVIGVKSNDLDTDYYLLPVVGVTGDNKLGTWSDDWDEEYSDAITIDTNSTVSNIDGGLRMPPEKQPTTAYTINVGSTVTAQTGYTVASNVITFNTNASSHTYTISGTATNTRRIVIPSGVTANITLNYL